MRRARTDLPERRLTPEELEEAAERIRVTGENAPPTGDNIYPPPSKKVAIPESFRGKTHVQTIMEIENDKIYRYTLTRGAGSAVKQPFLEIDWRRLKDITAAEDGSMIDKKYEKGQQFSDKSLASIYNALLHPESSSPIAPSVESEYSMQIKCHIKINEELEKAVSSPKEMTWRKGKDIPIAMSVEVGRHVLIVILFNGKIYSIGVGVDVINGYDKLIINTPDFLDKGTTRIIDICILTKSQLDWLKNFLMIGVTPSTIRLRFRRRINVEDGYVLDSFQIISDLKFAIASTSYRATYNCAKFLNEFMKNRILCTTLLGVFDPHACTSLLSLPEGVTPATHVKAYFILYLAGHYDFTGKEKEKNEAVTALQTLLKLPGKTHEEIERVIIDMFLLERKVSVLNGTRRFFSFPKGVGSTSTEAVKGGRRKTRNQRKSKTRKTRRSYSRKSA